MMDDSLAMHACWSLIGIYGYCWWWVIRKHCFCTCTQSVSIGKPANCVDDLPWFCQSDSVVDTLNFKWLPSLFPAPCFPFLILLPSRSHPPFFFPLFNFRQTMNLTNGKAVCTPGVLSSLQQEFSMFGSDNSKYYKLILTCFSGFGSSWSAPGQVLFLSRNRKHCFFQCTCFMCTFFSEHVCTWHIWTWYLAYLKDMICVIYNY